MNAVVKKIKPDSPASRTIIAPGDTLRKINGHVIADVLDYIYHSYDERLFLELTGPTGKLKLTRVNKSPGADLGVEFETYLMDTARSCANKCVFCFIDQLPRGMRKTLYYKDDDVRLSFLQGNYITLTNLSKRDIERIIKLRVSPINVSVHTLNPILRNFMLGNDRAADGITVLRKLARSGITVNCQIVCCPGINDGAELLSTMKGLYELSPSVNSVSVVPVGLTKYREELPILRPFDRQLAQKTVRQVEAFAEKCRQRRGARIFFCADELYIKAELPLPENEYYESYPQLENGVGMMRLLISEFQDELSQSPEPGERIKPFSIATGVSASKYLEKLLFYMSEKYGNIDAEVYPVKNEFFGHSVNVAGLVTGGDILRELSGKEKLGERLLIPVNMLRQGEEVFLDDMTVSELADALGVPIRVVRQDGADLLHAFLGG